MPATLVQQMRAPIQMSDETGPKNLVEREEGLSRGAGPPFQG